MKLFDGLKPHEAIKVSDGSYIVQLDRTFINHSYMINGVVTSGSNRQVVVDDLSKIKRYIPESKVVTAAIISDGSEISIDELDNFNQKYVQYLKYDGHYDFGDDIDAEIAHLKDKAKYKVKEYIYDTVPAKTQDLEITVVGSVEDTGSDFITTPFVYGNVRHDGYRTAGIYKVEVAKIALDEFNKLKNEFTDAQYIVPDHSHMKYIKINGEYAFTKIKENWVEKSNACKIISSLEEAKELEKAVRKTVRETAMLNIKPREISGTEIREVINDLELLKERVSALHVKQKSSTDFRTTIRAITELVTKYKQMN